MPRKSENIDKRETKAERDNRKERIKQAKENNNIHEQMEIVMDYLGINPDNE